MSEHVEAIRRETEALERQLAAREAEIVILRLEVGIAARRAGEADKRAKQALADKERLRSIIAGIREVTDQWQDLEGPPPARGSEQERVLADIRDGVQGRASTAAETAKFGRTFGANPAAFAADHAPAREKR
jgi:hypothetical protein